MFSFGLGSATLTCRCANCLLAVATEAAVVPGFTCHDIKHPSVVTEMDTRKHTCKHTCEFGSVDTRGPNMRAALRGL